MGEYNMVLDELADIKLLNQQILELVEEQGNTLREIEKVIGYLPLEEDDVKYPCFEEDDVFCDCDCNCDGVSKIYSLNVDDDSINDMLRDIKSVDDKEHDSEPNWDDMLEQLIDMNIRLGELISKR